MSTTPSQAAPHCFRHPARETWIRCQRCDRPICPDCMVGAAVGFQCPECVKAGAKTTRSGRAAYGGQRSADPRLTTFVLIGINVAVWVLMTASAAARRLLPLMPGGRCDAPGATDRYYPEVGSAVVCNGNGGEWVRGVADGSWWQLITSAFAHVEIPHLLFNMVGLFFLGPLLEVSLGRARFLAVYFFAALTGSALVMALSEPAAQTLGASGAIFGLMGALLVVAFKVRADMQTIGTWLLLNLAFTFFAGSSISWQGHLGGLVGGAVAAAVIVFAPKKNRPVFQWTTLSLLTGIVAIAIAATAAAL